MIEVLSLMYVCVYILVCMNMQNLSMYVFRNCFYSMFIMYSI